MSFINRNETNIVLAYKCLIIFLIKIKICLWLISMVNLNKQIVNTNRVDFRSSECFCEIFWWISHLNTGRERNRIRVHKRVFIDLPQISFITIIELNRIKIYWFITPILISKYIWYYNTTLLSCIDYTWYIHA